MQVLSRKRTHTGKMSSIGKGLEMGNQKIKEMTIGKDQAMVMTEEAVSELVKRISQQMTN